MINAEKILIKTVNDVMILTLERSLKENRLEGWIDMKINPSTLQDIYDKNAWCSKTLVYSWIQGRALETISEYLKNEQYLNFSKKDLIQLGDNLFDNILPLILDDDYINNKTNIKFVFDINGEKYNSFPTPTISDMFIIRGMLCYATFKGDNYISDILSKKLKYIIDCSINGELINDQLDFKTEKMVNYFEDKVGIEGAMLAIGASQILYNYTRDYNDLLLGYISIINITSIFSKKIDTNYYIIDYVDIQNNPVKTNDDYINNPGHCIEIIGLSLKFLRINNEILNENKENLLKIKNILINMGMSHFYLGRNINNTINLKVGIISKRVHNDCCPWWSSFEALRMLVEIYHINNDRDVLKLFYNQIDCINSIYLKDLDLYIPIQNVNSQGYIIEKIPATPDIDMGYHTSIPVFDVFSIF